MKPFNTVFPLERHDGGGGFMYSKGLTARDYIAIQAMTGLLAGFASTYKDAPSYESMAKESYRMADAMIKQSEVIIDVN